MIYDFGIIFITYLHVKVCKLSKHNIYTVRLVEFKALAG